MTVALGWPDAVRADFSGASYVCFPEKKDRAPVTLLWPAEAGGG